MVVSIFLSSSLSFVSLGLGLLAPIPYTLIYDLISI